MHIHGCITMHHHGSPCIIMHHVHYWYGYASLNTPETDYWHIVRGGVVFNAMGAQRQKTRLTCRLSMSAISPGWWNKSKINDQDTILQTSIKNSWRQMNCSWWWYDSWSLGHEEQMTEAPTDICIYRTWYTVSVTWYTLQYTLHGIPVNLSAAFNCYALCCSVACFSSLHPYPKQIPLLFFPFP